LILFSGGGAKGENTGVDEEESVSWFRQQHWPLSTAALDKAQTSGTEV